MLKERQNTTKSWARGRAIRWPEPEQQDEKEMQSMRIQEKNKILRDSR